MTEREKYELWQFERVRELSKSATLVRNLRTGALMVYHVSPAENFPVMREISMINNANLMRVYDTVLQGSACVSLCEYLDAVTLEQAIDFFGVYDEKTAVNAILSVCNGLEALHRRGIVHRDISPSNVMVCRDGTVKIIDFDITRTQKPGMKKDTQILGTLGYASPEQFGFAQTEARADIYSCGVLLNFMLTGRLPDEKPYQGPLRPVIERCTEIDREKRYASAAELADAVKWVSRHPKRAMDAPPAPCGRRIAFKVVSVILLAIYIPFFAAYIVGWFKNPEFTADAESIRRNVVMGVDVFGLFTLFPYVFFSDAFGLLRRIFPKNPGAGRGVGIFLGVVCLIAGLVLLGISDPPQLLTRHN